jgi:hypothetical protein
VEWEEVVVGMANFISVALFLGDFFGLGVGSVWMRGGMGIGRGRGTDIKVE